MIHISRSRRSSGFLILRTFVLLCICPIILLISFASCTEFFTTSLATWAARDPENVVPNVNAGNVQSVIASFENDPNASLVVLKRIQDTLQNAPNDEKPELQAAALTAATNSVGLVSAVLGAVDTNINEIKEEDAKDIVNNAINNLKNLDSAGSLLLDIIPDPNDQDAFDAFIDAAVVVDLAFAAVLLVAAESKKFDGDIEDYIDRFDPGFTGPHEPAEDLVLAIAEAIIDKVDGTLEDFLKGLNLF